MGGIHKQKLLEIEKSKGKGLYVLNCALFAPKSTHQVKMLIQWNYSFKREYF